MKREDLSTNARYFSSIKKGDLILAYARHNRIAYVGEIKDGVCRRTTKNIIGMDKKEGGFGYPQQFAVNWYETPTDFSRHNLPVSLRDQLGKKGKTVTLLDLGKRSFDEVKNIILKCAESESLSYDVNEDMIKAGFRKYLHRNLDNFERGLKILKAEKNVSEGSRPDFIAEDKNGYPVIIECKGRAYASDCEQLRKYKKDYGKETRLILLAFKIDSGCLKPAREEGIELMECDLRFNRINVNS
jgi:predicted Mrr-cat superfamily restriction endonuclease